MSLFIKNWQAEIQTKIDAWLIDKSTTSLKTTLFKISPLGTPVIHNPLILNHYITSCCPEPTFHPISFDHFPEPYYGDPSDELEKLTVVLFYNPGPSGDDQLYNNTSAGSFLTNYTKCGNNYSQLSSKLLFCAPTINSFWNTKNKQLLNLFHDLDVEIEGVSPFFLDLIPWHSNRFSGVDKVRISSPETKKEIINNVILPAACIAKNSVITRFYNDLHCSDNGIIIFAVGSLYSKYSNGSFLSVIGFKDITSNLINSSGIIGCNNEIRIIKENKQKGTFKIWHKNSDDLEYHDAIETKLKGQDIFIINMWTPNIGMNIPKDSADILYQILLNLKKS